MSIKIFVNDNETVSVNINELGNYLKGLLIDKLDSIKFQENIIIELNGSADDVVTEENVIDVVGKEITEGLNKYKTNIEEVGELKVKIEDFLWKEKNIVEVNFTILIKEDKKYSSYLTICDMTLFSYDKDKEMWLMREFIIDNNFNDKQNDYILEWCEEMAYSSPNNLDVSVFKDTMAERVVLNGLDNYLGLSDRTLREIVNTDFSYDIKEYILDGDIDLMLFADYFKVTKEDDIYRVYFMDLLVEKIIFSVGLKFSCDF